MTIQEELKELLASGRCPEKMVSAFSDRLRQGELSRDENPESHLCAYFAAYDPKGKVFIGHHKKSGLWIFNGGHVDRGENLRRTVAREIGEEWGLDSARFEIGQPRFLTITDIDNPAKQRCRIHYDAWFFIPTDGEKFEPDPERLLSEFHEAGWKGLDEAKDLVNDANTSEALDFIRDNLFES